MPRAKQADCGCTREGEAAHSNTRFARASTGRGIVRPSVLALPMLTTELELGDLLDRQVGRP
jgi:hypothetical protein